MELVDLYRHYPELSLRRFAEAVGVAYYRLRDFLRSEQQRRRRAQHEQALRRAVRAVALAHPTYGHRPWYQELRAQGDEVGRERCGASWASLSSTQRPIESAVTLHLR